MHESIWSKIWHHRMFLSVAWSDTGAVRGVHLRSFFFFSVVFSSLYGSVYFLTHIEENEINTAVQAVPEYEEKIAVLKNEQVARAEQIKIFAHELGVLQARLDRFDVISERLFDAPEIGKHLENIEKDVSAQGGFTMPEAGNEEVPSLNEMKERVSAMQQRTDHVETLMQAGLHLVASSQMSQQQRPSLWPAIHSRTRLTSNFGYRRDPFGNRTSFHGGVDLAGGHNAPIVSTANGVVVFSGYRYNYGITVEIRHAGGFSTRYAHMNEAVAKNGQKVKAGEIIGRMGSTGRSTGPHLHFEVLVGDTKVDPKPFIRGGDKKAKETAASAEFSAKVAALTK